MRFQEGKKKVSHHASRMTGGASVFQFALGIGQIVAATVCLYFLLTRGEDNATKVSAIVAGLLMLLSLSFKLARRFPRK